MNDKDQSLQEESLFNNDSIYILPNTLSKNYLQDLKKASLKNNFKICDEFKYLF